MGFYHLSVNPEYQREVRALENSDPANAELIFNPLMLAVLNNIEAVRLSAGSSFEMLQNQLHKVSQDVSTLAFKLAIRGYIDTSGMKQVIVDVIDSESSVTILSGTFNQSQKKVLI